MKPSCMEIVKFCCHESSSPASNLFPNETVIKQAVLLEAISSSYVFIWALVLGFLIPWLSINADIVLMFFFFFLFSCAAHIFVGEKMVAINLQIMFQKFKCLSSQRGGVH